MTDTPSSGAKPAPASQDKFDLVLGKATDTFSPWQQVPAWVLGAAAILGGAALLAFPKHFTADQSRDAWAGVIVALFLAALLSYRSALTLSDGPATGQGKPADGAPRGPGPAGGEPLAAPAPVLASPPPARDDQPTLTRPQPPPAAPGDPTGS